MTLSAIHNCFTTQAQAIYVVCDIGGYDFVSFGG